MFKNSEYGFYLDKIQVNMHYYWPRFGQIYLHIISYLYNKYIYHIYHHKDFLTSQINLLILYQVFAFYTVKINTDFKNIKKKMNIFKVSKFIWEVSKRWRQWYWLCSNTFDILLYISDIWHRHIHSQLIKNFCGRVSSALS